MLFANSRCGLIRYLTTKEHFHEELHTYKEGLRNSRLSGKASCKAKEEEDDDDDTPAKKVCPEAVPNAAEECPPGTSTSQQESQMVGQLPSSDMPEEFERPMEKVTPEVMADVKKGSTEAQDVIYEPIKTGTLLEISETKGEKSDIKQKRARGQNKHRPHMKPSHYDDISLCSAFWQVSLESVCVRSCVRALLCWNKVSRYPWL